jgi:hypothetical protein
MIQKDMGVVLKPNSEEEFVEVVSNYDRNRFLSKEDIHQYIKSKYGVIAVGKHITELLLKCI